ncbi:MAG: hypothetical protein II312_09585 [Lachnospiraceae bacterium]|nr:hypothetical protein [Lachnospiraceae bacterium]MEE0920028.1 hypothetical protein [Lachnospiraceae bacterium]
MATLLAIREQMRNFYSKYELYITPVCKFLFALITIILINNSIGYMSTLKSMAVVLILALMCSFMPMNFTVVISAIITIGHMYAFSKECAVIAVAVIILLFILYFRFSPRDTIAVLLTPICFMLKVPYIMPIVMGLVGTPASVFSVCSGVIVYYTISYMVGSESVLNTFDADGALEKFRYVIDGLMTNKAMFVVVAAFAFTLMVVYFIRRLSVDYAWTIAMITGALVNILFLLIGDLIYNTNISIAGVVVGGLVSVLVAKILEFFVFNVDYSRTEMVQFEDDEYYYYVKAVPKNTVAAPQKRVKTIRVPEKAVKQNINKR